MSAQTPIYLIDYLTGGDRAKDIPAVSKAQALRMEQALLNAQVPPGNPDLTSVLTRLNALEAVRPKAQFSIIGTDQTLTTGTKTALNWNNREGTTTLFNATTPTRLIAPTAGMYRITTTCVFSNVGSGFRSIALRVNGGGSDLELCNSPVPSGTYNNAITGIGYVQLNAGDYVEVMAEVLAPASTVVARSGATTNWISKFSNSRAVIEYVGA